MKKILLSFLFFLANLSNAAPENNQTTPAPASNALTGLAPIAPKPTIANLIQPPPEVHARGFMLMDANSGQILAAANADQRMEPASLTKLMLMYVISEQLQSGKIHLTDRVPISKNAWRTGGSRMFIKEGTQVSVQDLVNGIVVASGNDAAVAMAEYIGGGDENNFVNLMNQAAASLGMKNSHFMDVNGLPASNHYSSPHDLAILARALINQYPNFYPWYGQKWEEYGNIKQSNRNRLLWRDPSVDGLKTGFTNGAGYCLVASAKRNDMRLISVVMGEPTVPARVNDSMALLNWGFRSFSSHQLFAANQTLAAPRVWFGQDKTANMGLIEGLAVTIPNGQYQNLKAFLTVDKDLHAPIVKGQSYGQVEVTLNNQPLLTQPLVALQNNPSGGVFRYLSDRVSMFLSTM